MEQEIELSQEEEAALEQIDNLTALRVTTGTRAVAALQSGDLCEKYRTIRGALKILVGILRRLGSIGKKAAEAIEFLMSLADTVCPA